MNRLRLIRRSMGYYRRMHLGVFAGAVVGAAVLTGALLVGDSVDASLRGIALARLGDTAHALDTRKQYFREELGERLSMRMGHTIPSVLRLRGMALAEPPAVPERRQANRVQVLGVGKDFWTLAGGGDGIPASPGPAAVINTHLAQRLGVGAGDEIALRIEIPDRMSRDAPLSARDEDRSIRVRLTVERVAPDRGLGRFSLATDQTAPYNVFLPRAWLQEQVRLPGEVNLLLAGTAVEAEKLAHTLRDEWSPADVGLHVRGKVLESDRVFLGGPVAKAALTLPNATGTLAYLVNTISRDGKRTPYSFMVAGATPKGMDDDEIIISEWLSGQISASVGDTVTVAYSVLLPDNRYEERKRDFTVRGIASMDAMIEARKLVPSFPGLEDVENCADWDVGLPMDEELLADKANEAYWDAYHTTPKALVTLAAGQAMWSNRFGSLTAVRFAGKNDTPDAILAGLKDALDPAAVGLVFRPVREEALTAVSRAIDFGGLFLGMSFFLILSAFLLTGLLFVLGAQYRAGEMGILLALGFTPAQARRQLLAEAGLVAVAGGATGALAGCGYTWALIQGLAHYWQSAVAHSPILFHVTPGTLLTGAVASSLAALFAMVTATWRQVRLPARQLLTLDFASTSPGRERFPRAGLWFPLLGLAFACVSAVCLALYATGSIVEPFFGVGALVLLSGLGLCRHALCVLGAGSSARHPTLFRLALQNMARRRARSLSVIVLLASGCFLVFAVSAMKEDLTKGAHRRASGTGGFALFGESTLSLLEAPSDTAVGIKVRDGDDASCLNLNHAMTPRLLGVNGTELASRGAFASREQAKALWSLLDLDLPDGVIPALVGDSDTAMWGLKAKMGVENGDELTYLDDRGESFRVRLVASLPMRLSVFQGTILIADQYFTERFPSEAGYRMFLIDAPPGEAATVARSLNRRFEREGIEVIPSVKRLARFYAVESTYLGMFLVLGGLGVLLGTVGMGIVTLRNLLERRGEIAMLRAVGYNTVSIRRLLLMEHGMLAAMGLALGVIAAAVAMIPAIASASSGVALGLQLQLLAGIALCAAGCIALALRAARPGRDLSALRNE